MRKFYPALTISILASALSLSGCGSSQKDMRVMTAAEEQAPMEMASSAVIEEALESDYLRSQIENHISDINPKVKLEKGHYSIGDLTNDGIPELVLFVERNPEDVNDHGMLEVYGFNELEHYLIDKVPMNYDNTNHILRTGLLSNTQQGILLSNQVGSQASVTYGFILEDGKLKSILNPKKINLVSVTANNSIEDMNGDGILDFSIYTIDPETKLSDSKEADRILLWYNWDGKDGARVLQPDWTTLQRSSINSDASAGARSFTAAGQPVPGSVDFIPALKELAKKAPKDEIVSLLSSHIDNLEMNSLYRSLDIAALINRFANGSSFDAFLASNSLRIEDINNSDVIGRKGVLSSQSELKDLLLKNLELGYLLKAEDGRYEYKVDYNGIAEQFGDILTNEFRGYLRIMSKESINPHIVEGSLKLDRSELAQRLIEIEKFRLTYSYSQRLDKVLELYASYMDSLLYRNKNGYGVDPSTGKVAPGHIQELKELTIEFPGSYFTDVINKLLTSPSVTSSGMVDQKTKEEIRNLIP